MNDLDSSFTAALGGGGADRGSYAAAWGGDQGLRSSSVGGGPFSNAPSFVVGGGGSHSIGGHHPLPPGHRRSASSAAGAGAGAGPAIVPAFGGGDLATFASRVAPGGVSAAPVVASPQDSHAPAAPAAAEAGVAATATAIKETE